MNDIQKDVQDFNNLHPNRKLAVFGIVLLVFVLSIVVGIYFSQANQSNGTPSTTQTGTTEDASKTTLALVPSADTVKVGDTVKVSVMLSGTAVPASDIVISYDPAQLAISEDDIVVGAAFKSLPFKKIENGKIIASALVDLNNTADVRTGEVMSFTFEALKAGTTELAFDVEEVTDIQKTITSRVGGFDTLKGTQNAKITIQ